MPQPLPASRPENRPNHVWVYGTDHSPWVQAVLLGLHEKAIAHTLVTVPPLSVFLESGTLMPAASIDGGGWMLDSERILVELGFSQVEERDRRALQRVFGSGAMRRTDDPWKFWQRFSLVRDGHPEVTRRLWNQFWRPFSVFYFFTLITFGRRRRRSRTTGQLIEEFSFFQERLGPDRDFLAGRAPDTVDLQLFGLVQMCATIPGPSFEVLRQEPKLERLRGWIQAMQRRFSGYAHLYTGPCFEPRLPEPEPASKLERVFYWCGAALMWIAFPITLAATFYFVRRVRKKGLLRA